MKSGHDPQLPIHFGPMRFRPNLIVTGGQPYAEDNWRGLNIGKEHFTVSFLELSFTFIW